MAAPLVVVRIGHPSAAHRQQVQVADQFQQIGIRVEQHGVIALLKQMPGLALAPVYAPRVLAAEPLHEPPYRHVGDLYDQADRIDLPTIGVHSYAAADQHRRQQSLESRVVGWVGKDRLTCIAALDDVVDALRHVKSGSA